MIKTDQQLQDSIGRFQAFWAKQRADRFPVGVAPDGLFLPVKYLRNIPSQNLIGPELPIDAYHHEYDYVFAGKHVISDDFMPFSACWRAIPWLEAICGCDVKYASGSLYPTHILDESAFLKLEGIEPSRDWLKRLETETKYLCSIAPDNCWVSPSILRGNSDVIAALRGLTEFYYDIVTIPRQCDKVASWICEILTSVLDMHFGLVRPKHGGYCHIYGYWAPEPTIVIQEDVLGMCSPDIFRDIFCKYCVKIINHLGNCILFHLHSTGYANWEHVLAMPGIAGIEITIEQNGPSPAEMLTVLRKIAEQSRLVLFADHYFEEVLEILKYLPKETLYLIISDKYIKKEKQLKELLRSVDKY